MGALCLSGPLSSTTSLPRLVFTTISGLSPLVVYSESQVWGFFGGFFLKTQIFSPYVAYDAEITASKMISEDRLKGKIDQIDKVIYFATDSSSLNQWDKHIQTACDAVNGITDQLAQKYPQYV
jgi:hypothetical protein